MSPRVSVVVPAYNNEAFIKHTMDSILAQTYDDLEIIVADHSSSDGTRAILDTFAADSRVRIEVTPTGGGAPANWNRVTELASGHYIKLVCGDDLLHPSLVARQVDALDAAGDRAVICAVQRDLVDARGKVFMRARGLGRLDGVVDGRVALRATVRAGTNIFGEPACVLMRRDALASAGGWDGSNPYYIDAGTYARVLVQGDLVAVRDSLAAFRVSAGQWSVALMRSQYTQAVGFHNIAQGLAPDYISPGDVRWGNAMARIVTLQRRLAYLVLGRRMNADPRPKQ